MCLVAVALGLGEQVVDVLDAEGEIGDYRQGLLQANFVLPVS